MNRGFDAPWQRTPAELIEYALEHLQRETDVEQQVGYLRLDLGVETLFKTFLLIPSSASGALTSFTKRRKAASGNFHELVEGVKRAVPADVKGDFDWESIQYYHSIRNKLYHEGDGVTVRPNNAHAYAELAVDLLVALLNVDLTDVLRRPEMQREQQQREQELREALVAQVAEVRWAVGELEDVVMSPMWFENGYVDPSLIREQAALRSLSHYYFPTDDDPYTEPYWYLYDDEWDGWLFYEGRFVFDAFSAELQEYLLSLRRGEFEERLFLWESLIDPVSFYLMLVDKARPREEGPRRDLYEYAKMYPDCAFRERLAGVDSGGNPILDSPSISEVIDEGERLVADLLELTKASMMELIGTMPH